MKQPKNPPQLNRRLVFQITAIFVLLMLISLSAYLAFDRLSQQNLDSISTYENFHTVQPIPLSGEIMSNKAEISGMAWYGDSLILLPQYPHRLGKRRAGKLFVLPKADILAFLDGSRTNSLVPTEVPINTYEFKKQIPGFEGFEAIAFNGEQVYLTIEASGPMRGYLATGKIDPNLKSLTMDPAFVKIPLPAKIDNFADEAIIVFQDKIYTFYEANGINDNPHPVAQSFNLELDSLGTLPLPNIEYRLTDASTPDADGNFWVINFFFWGDLIKIKPGTDMISPGRGKNNLFIQPIERLVELKVTENGIVPGNQDPIRIALADNGTARNWEALASLDERGFLIATDKYPETILAFISR